MKRFWKWFDQTFLRNPPPRSNLFYRQVVERKIVDDTSTYQLEQVKLECGHTIGVRNFKCNALPCTECANNGTFLIPSGERPHSPEVQTDGRAAKEKVEGS